MTPRRLTLLLALALLPGVAWGQLCPLDADGRILGYCPGTSNSVTLTVPIQRWASSTCYIPDALLGVVAPNCDPVPGVAPFMPTPSGGICTFCDPNQRQPEHLTHPDCVGADFKDGNGVTTRCSAEDRSYRLLTQSYGGTVSLLRDLTKRECEEAKDKVSTPINHISCRARHQGDTVFVCEGYPGDIRSAECFQ